MVLHKACDDDESLNPKLLFKQFCHYIFKRKHNASHTINKKKKCVSNKRVSRKHWCISAYRGTPGEIGTSEQRVATLDKRDV